MYSDYGSVFVRERGELHCVNADAGQNLLSKPHRLFQRDFSVRLCTGSCEPISRQTTDHFIFTYNSQGSLCYTARPLLDISLHFIADHIEHVDSLVGFPEEMAHRLFVAAEEKQKFSDSSTSARALQVFSEAYGELMLKSLCLRDRGLLVSERLEEIQVFYQLESLDLYGCRLGDDHDIFRHITSEAFSRLVRLFLGDNCLSDKGLQRLTAPVRVMKKGLENLQQLDISRNPLTEKGLGYLMCLKNLRELDVSGTSVKSDACLRSLFSSRMGMVMSPEPLRIFSHCECRTEGWAEEVINQWERKASELRKKDSKLRTNALQFYGREKFVRENIHTKSEVQKIQNECTTIHFYKPDPHSTSQQTEHKKDTPSRTVLTPQTGRKRRLCNEREEKEGLSPPAKRQPVRSFTADDLDLLNSY
ncbi:leucine-rich repeat-containing protein 42 [Astyanax mexicanus]|uniref:Leucine-rich repeat-containing protein 42 n=1 Tax=Astyanax mexicanus TaxID=7994 RepID=A0A8B9KKI6_ASTMX|nr:leucine-rich repeat-containing protein 42 [Astyanax mexicanus]